MKLPSVPRSHYPVVAVVVLCARGRGRVDGVDREHARGQEAAREHRAVASGMAGPRARGQRGRGASIAHALVPTGLCFFYVMWVLGFFSSLSTVRSRRICHAIFSSLTLSRKPEGLGVLLIIIDRRRTLHTLLLCRIKVLHIHSFALSALNIYTFPREADIPRTILTFLGV